MWPSKRDLLRAFEDATLNVDEFRLIVDEAVLLCHKHNSALKMGVANAVSELCA